MCSPAARASGALVYRLKKIEALAGTGTRDPRTSLTLYLACLLDELDAPAAGDR